MRTPEATARNQIDDLLAACGWQVQDVGQANIHAARGVVLRASAPAMRPSLGESSGGEALCSADLPCSAGPDF